MSNNISFAWNDTSIFAMSKNIMHIGRKTKVTNTFFQFFTIHGRRILHIAITFSFLLIVFKRMVT